MWAIFGGRENEVNRSLSMGDRRTGWEGGGLIHCRERKICIGVGAVREEKMEDQRDEEEGCEHLGAE